MGNDFRWKRKMYQQYLTVGNYVVNLNFCFYKLLGGKYYCV